MDDVEGLDRDDLEVQVMRHNHGRKLRKDQCRRDIKKVLIDAYKIRTNWRRRRLYRQTQSMLSR